MNRKPAETEPVTDIVPDGCTGSAFAFSEGVLHVNKDGSGYIAVDERQFCLEDDRCEGPDGPEGSVHWITRLPPGEIQALRDFLNGFRFNATAEETSEIMANAAIREERDIFQKALERISRHPVSTPLLGRPSLGIAGWPSCQEIASTALEGQIKRGK